MDVHAPVTTTGGPALPQERRLVTEIPGPALARLAARKGSPSPAASAPRCRCSPSRPAAASSSTSTATRLIDLGSGIAVTTRRQQRTRGWSRPCRSRSTAFTHTCFMITPYEGYVAVAEALNRLTPGDHEKRQRPVQLRRRGGRERGQDRPRPHRPAGRRRVRPRLPRPHQPDDGDDREVDALQERLRPVRRPRSTAPRCPTLPRREGMDGAAAAAARDRRHREAGRRRQPRRRRDRADPGRGRLHRAGRRLPARDRRVVHAPTASCSSPTRCRPASPAPAPCSPATTRASCPT